MRTFAVSIVVGFSLFVTACASTLPVPNGSDGTWAASQWPGTNTDALTRGRELYANRCGACHVLHEPSSYPASRWPRLVDDMVHNANLQPPERDAIVHYLLSVIRDGRDAPAH